MLTSGRLKDGDLMEGLFDSLKHVIPNKVNVSEHKSIRDDDANEVHLNVISRRDYSYDIRLNSRFTLVSDFSYSGKTHLCELLQYAKRNRLQVECNIPFKVITDVATIERVDTTTLFLIDEDAECIATQIKSLEYYIINTHHYFLIFSRDMRFKGVPYSVDDIKVLRVNNGVIHLESKFGKFPINDIKV